MALSVASAPVAARRVPVPRDLWVPLVAFTLTRLVGAVVLLVLSDDQGPRTPSTGTWVSDPAPAAPGYAEMPTNWDGQWYGEVAIRGYPSELPRVEGEVVQNPLAFYPVFPLLVRLLMGLTRLPFPVAASVVSTSCAALAAVVFYRLLEPRVGAFNAGMAVLALGLAPAAVVLQAAYAESTALLFLVVSLTLLVRRRYGWFCVAAVALSLTRPVVLPLAILVLVHGVARLRDRQDAFQGRERLLWAIAFGTTVASFGAWPAVCALLTGEPAAFLLTQDAWIRGYPGEPTWLLSLVRHPTATASVIAVAVLAVGVVVVVRRTAAPWGLELRWWVPLYGLYLLATASPVASSVRYSLLALVPWWPVTRPVRGRRRRVVLVAYVLVLGTLGQIAWARLFYVIGPDAAMFP